MSFKQEFLKEMERIFISSLKESNVSLQSVLTPCVLQLWSLVLFRGCVRVTQVAGQCLQGLLAGVPGPPQLALPCRESARSPRSLLGSSISWRDNLLRAHLLQAD